MKRGRLLEYRGPDTDMSFGKVTNGYKVYEVIHDSGRITYTNDEMQRRFFNDLGLSLYTFHKNAQFVDPVSHTKLYKAME